MSSRFERILNRALEAPHNIPAGDLAGILVHFADEGFDAELFAGANVVMPVLTPADCRAAYNLYPGKTDAR